MQSEHLTASERFDNGLAIRDTVHRASHSAWSPPEDRADPMQLIDQSNAGRLDDLIPLRFKRMKKSAFAFFRGSAILMAHDLAIMPNTGILVQSCGDCHLQNFGWFATPERNLAFDVTDFDETAEAPWEWDLKRLATSFALTTKNQDEAGRLAREVCRTYRIRMKTFSQMPAIEVWYARLDMNFLTRQVRVARQLQALKLAAKRAESQTIESWLPKLTEGCGDGRVFRENSQELLHRDEPEFQLDAMQQVFDTYQKTIQEDRRKLLARYRMVSAAFKVVGVGSVGLRCLVGLLLDDRNEPLVLQIKEARPSVLAPFVAPSKESHQGHRIVQGQRLMQSASDIFLGWGQGPHDRDYYVRQLRDMKLSFDSEKMTGKQLLDYSQLCGWALARAHAKSGKSLEISGYLGESEKFDRALETFALTYSQQVKADYRAFKAELRRRKQDT